MSDSSGEEEEDFICDLVDELSSKCEHRNSSGEEEDFICDLVDELNSKCEHRNTQWGFKWWEGNFSFTDDGLHNKTGCHMKGSIVKTCNTCENIINSYRNKYKKEIREIQTYNDVISLRNEVKEIKTLVNKLLSVVQKSDAINTTPRPNTQVTPANPTP